MAGPGPVCVRCHDDKWRLSARHWCDACEDEDAEEVARMTATPTGPEQAVGR